MFFFYLTVVSLSRVENLPVILDTLERTATCENSLSFRKVIGLFGGALGLRGRVRQSEYDGSLVQRGHLLDNVLGEDLTLTRSSDYSGRLHVIDYLAELF